MSRQPLSKEAEQSITTALSDVVDLVNAGSSPNDAVVKVATDRKMQSGHVSLMCHAFNIGRSETQRKSSDDLFDKSAEFDLANASVILDRMFPEVVKSAGVLVQETVVSAEYATPPSRLLNRDNREKEARRSVIDWKMVEPPAPLPRDPAHQTKKALTQITNARRQCEELRRAAQFQFDLVNGMVEKLATSLRSEGNCFVELKRDSIIKYGELAEALFSHMEKANKVLVKSASHGPLSLTACKKVENIMEATQSFKLAKDAYIKAAAELPEKERALLDPFVEGPALTGGSVLGPCSVKAANLLSGLIGTAVGSTVGRGMAAKNSPTTEALQQNMKAKLTDPQQEASLRNIQTESMLTDLMANDEVISGYNPTEVIGHFNEISQLSPRATNQSGLMRALLRKRLQQGALDPYEVDLLLKIENGLKSRDNPVPGGVMGNGPAGVM